MIISVTVIFRESIISNNSKIINNRKSTAYNSKGYKTVTFENQESNNQPCELSKTMNFNPKKSFFNKNILFLKNGSLQISQRGIYY